MKNRSTLICVLVSISLFIAGLLLMPGALVAQSAPAKLTFDVATIRPAAPLDPQKIAADMQAGKMPRVGPHISADRAEYFYSPLKALIAAAYKVQGFQVSGPDWLATDRFDIEATLPEGASKDDVPAMLQALLADRFKLVAHRETAEHKVLALIVSKDGPKLKESTATPEPLDPNAPLKPGEMTFDGPDGPIRMTRNHDGSMTFNMGAKGTMTQKLDAQNQSVRIDSSMVTMAGFADTLSAIMTQMGGTQVVDMTGLKGNYEVSVEIALSDLMAMARSQGFGPPPGPGGGGPANAAAGPTASDPGGGTSVYQSVKQLGLELEDRKAPVEQLVVDHVEKQPTEN
jgi:uncharacterized protein (TIGR03435 family)